MIIFFAYNVILSDLKMYNFYCVSYFLLIYFHEFILH